VCQLAVLPLQVGGIDLVHAGVQHRHHVLGAMLVARLLGHGMERIDGQHPQAAPATGAKRQALCHRAGGAQPGE
jgi:hypothetical protein